MPTNASPAFYSAQGKYLEAKTIEEKIIFLKDMIKEAPKHKSSENLLANLKTRLKKLELENEKKKKSGKSSSKGIKKADLQAVLISKTNSGKSSLLKVLTNTNPKISENKFTTKEPIVGILNYQDVQIQIIENPSIESENYYKGLTNSADVLLILITSLKELGEIENILQKEVNNKNFKPNYKETTIQKTKLSNNNSGKVEGERSAGGWGFPNSFQKIIILFNKSDNLTEEQKRKISANLQSKKYNFVLISTITQEGLEELKEKILSSFDKIRIFTKEPGKEKSQKPIIMKPGATTRDVAEKILKGFSNKVKETRIWGPSSKFGGQIVGLSHVLKDMDVVEFKTR